MMRQQLIEQIRSGEILLDVDSTEGVRVLFAGDFYAGNRTEDLCRRHQYDVLFNDTLSVLKQKDLSVVNLECPLTTRLDPIPKSGPNLHADPKCVDALRYAGFDVATLANNHILDHGDAGVADTIAACRSVGMKTVGAGLTLGEAREPLVVDVQSSRIAFINIAENEFSIAQKNSAGANPLNLIENYYQIVQAKQNADAVFVIVHGGNEFYPLPSPRMVQTYRFFADLGAAAVIAHHPHCASGLEIHNGVPIFYSLGNFVFDVPKKQDAIWYNGFLVTLTLSERSVSRIALHPYEQFKQGDGVRLIHGSEREEYLRLISHYSSTIQHEQALVDHWNQFCLSKEMYYLSGLLRLNRVKRALIKRGLSLKYFIKRRELTHLLNLFRCEAHREVSITTLEKQFVARD